MESVPSASHPPPSRPSAFAEALLSAQALPDATVLWGAANDVVPTTPVHVAVAGSQLFIGSGVEPVRILLAASGAVQGTLANARFPLLVHDRRLLAMTPRGLSWFALADGAETVIEPSLSAAAFCPPAPSQHCAFRARAQLVGGTVRVAHKRQFCSWRDGGPVTPSGYHCHGEARLLRVDGNDAKPMAEPPPFTGAAVDVYRATHEDAEVHLLWEHGTPFLDYKNANGAKRLPLAARTDGRLQPSLDGSLVGLSALEAIPVHNMFLRRWRVFDFHAGQLVDLEGRHIEPVTPFVATTDTLLVNQGKDDALDDVTPTIAAYDRATGKLRWQEALSLPPPPARPSRRDDDGEPRPAAPH